jgi:hypothetical protein
VRNLILILAVRQNIKSCNVHLMIELYVINGLTQRQWEWHYFLAEERSGWWDKCWGTKVNTHKTFLQRSLKPLPRVICFWFCSYISLGTVEQSLPSPKSAILSLVVVIPLKPNGNLIYITATEKIVNVMFCMSLIVNKDYFPKQYKLIGPCNGKVWCSLWGTKWIHEYYLDELRLQNKAMSGS